MTLQELEPQIASVVASLNLSSLNMETLPASPAGRGPTERASRPAPGRAPPVTLASAPTPASRPRPVAFDLAARGASWPPPSGPGGCGPEPLADLEAIFGDPRRPCRGAVGEASAPWALSRGVLDTHALALVAPAAPAEPNGDPSLSAGSGDASCERRVAPCDRRGGRGRRSPCRSGITFHQQDVAAGGVPAAAGPVVEGGDDDELRRSDWRSSRRRRFASERSGDTQRVP